MSTKKIQSPSFQKLYIKPSVKNDSEFLKVKELLLKESVLNDIYIDKRIDKNDSKKTERFFVTVKRIITGKEIVKNNKTKSLNKDNLMRAVHKGIDEINQIEEDAISTTNFFSDIIKGLKRGGNKKP